MNQNADILLELGPYLPQGVVCALEGFEKKREITEIRLRRGQPLSVCCGNTLCCVGSDGKTVSPEEAMVLSDEMIREGWRLVTSSSVYALEEELKRGYITLRGGHRVGIAGTAVRRDGMVKTQKDVAAFNYRCARERKDCGLPLLRFLLRDGKFENTLLFSAPGCGKTTLLRDLTRLLSGGTSFLSPQNITVVDERGEIAAVYRGSPRYDVGPFTDVLSGFSKEDGITLALRSLAPNILVTDEIGSSEDRAAVEDAVRCGVKLLLTAHGGTLYELLHRPVIRELLQSGVFCYLVLLDGIPRPGIIRRVYCRKEREGDFFYVEDPDFSVSCRHNGNLRSYPRR